MKIHGWGYSLLREVDPGTWEIRCDVCQQVFDTVEYLASLQAETDRVCSAKWKAHRQADCPEVPLNRALEIAGADEARQHERWDLDFRSAIQGVFARGVDEPFHAVDEGMVYRAARIADLMAAQRRQRQVGVSRA